MKFILIKSLVQAFLRPRGKHAFLLSRKKSFCMMDIGCGNKSPSLVKNIRPDSYYIGLDICEAEFNDLAVADEYYFTNSENFHLLIGSQNYNKIDSILSNHNLEHCDNRVAVLDAINAKSSIGTDLFMAFPSDKTVSFPSRQGCLNYYDDPTHMNLPPDFDDVIDKLVSVGFKIHYSTKYYSPRLLSLIGFILEPFSKYFGKVLLGTWEYYGFESVIWASKEG